MLIYNERLSFNCGKVALWFWMCTISPEQIETLKSRRVVFNYRVTRTKGAVITLKGIFLWFAWFLEEKITRLHETNTRGEDQFEISMKVDFLVFSCPTCPSFRRFRWYCLRATPEKKWRRDLLSTARYTCTRAYFTIISEFNSMSLPEYWLGGHRYDYIVYLSVPVFHFLL